MLKADIQNFSDLILTSGSSFGKKVFLHSNEEKDFVITYEGLNDFTQSLQEFLQSHNIEQRSSIGVLLPNDILTALLFIAIPSINYIFVPINPKLSKEEVSYICEDSEVSFIIAIEGLSVNIPKRVNYVTVNLGSSWIEELLKNKTQEKFRLNKIDKSETAEIVYTSGTTGKPKGVELSHWNLISNAKGISSSFNFSEKDKFLTITPLFHNSGQLFTTLAPMWTGSKSLPIRPEIALGGFWDLVIQNKISWTLGMGSHINFLLSQSNRNLDICNHRLKGILTGGMKLDEDKRKAFEDLFNTKVFITYGLTETTSFATCESTKSTSSPGSVGKPMAINEIKIDEEAGGEVLIKGDNVFERYHKLDKLTSERKVNGWLRTGDIGYFDEKGNLFIKDRIDNMIIVSGENVYPAEIEQHSSLLDDLFEFIIVGKEHPIKGVELVMVYNLKENKLPREISWSKILSKVLANYKIPTRYINIKELGYTEIPKAANGKLLRNKIKKIVNN